ncbi:major tail protein [Mycobacterium phage Cornie]|uniref:Major tail protein n=1 Tax=Mycobacterium phage Cornie TaxID=2704043 RepID=A0A6G6XKV2_9CAUD|nr:major tail protein [Mycobacterium phage Cornie]QIG58390.1 major tail protein [Mycobacterium phage Cornie]
MIGGTSPPSAHVIAGTPFRFITIPKGTSLMAQPSTGTTWNAGGYNDIDSRFAERGGLQAVLVRDYRGAATDMSPFEADTTTVRWSPFAQDGQLRADLFAAKRVNGVWTINNSPNEGFWYIGAQAEDGGAERDPQQDSDDLMILQSNRPFDSDIVSESKTVKFTAVETAKPLIHRLEANLRLVDDNGDNLVPDPGTADYFVGTRVDTDSVERQLILLYAKRKAGKFIYRAEGYPLVKLDNQAAKSRSKTDPDSAELTFKVLVDPYFMIPDPDGANSLVPGVEGLWYSGDGWDDLIGDGS